MATHLQHHPRRGSQGIDECKLLTIEDSTAERRFHCIVFQLAADFISFLLRDMNSFQEETMSFDIFHHSHIWYELFKRREDTICAFQLFYVDGIDS